MLGRASRNPGLSFWSLRRHLDYFKASEALFAALSLGRK
ncbi:hypothetical protein CBM2585_A10094 [Cupriavidus taiwanensis]|nr:hypothetical protein CBM2585_A10094 [Cupriavidus taiwanensis]